MASAIRFLWNLLLIAFALGLVTGLGALNILQGLIEGLTSG